MLPRHGNDLNLGYNAEGRAVTLSKEQRATHLYVTGTTGTGKSKFLEHLIRQDIKQWRASKCGLLLIDPHGSLYDSLMDWMAHYRLDRPVIPIELKSREWVVAYNMLRERPEADSNVVVTNFVQAIAHVWGQSDTKSTPLFARWAGNVLRTLYDAKHTLVESDYLTDYSAGNIRRMLVQQTKSPSAQRDWRYAEALSPTDFESQIGSTVNRLRTFLETEKLRAMFGQSDVSLDMGKALSEGQIILVNLSREGMQIGPDDASLLGTLLLSDVWAAAQERGKGDARNPMKPFYVYIDEFQDYVTPTISKGLDQARGFGLHLTLSHQFPKQLLNAGEHGAAVYDSAMANARSKVVFQMEGEDNLRPLVDSLFMGIMNPDEVKRELYATKVIGHQRETRVSVTRSSSTSEGSGDSLGQIRLEDGTLLDRVSEHNSNSQVAGSGYSECEVEIDRPVLGQELSSVQFRSLDEQRFRAMSALAAQQRQHCFIRLAGDTTPSVIGIPKVDSYGTKPERIAYRVKQYAKKWPFLLSTAEAKARLQARKETLEKLAAVPSGEPKTARRRIK